MEAFRSVSIKVLASLPYAGIEHDGCGLKIARQLLAALPSGMTVDDQLFLWSKVYRSFWPDTSRDPLMLTFSSNEIVVCLAVSLEELEPIRKIESTIEEALTILRTFRPSLFTVSSSSSSWTSETPFLVEEKVSIHDYPSVHSRFQAHFSHYFPFFEPLFTSACVTNFAHALFDRQSHDLELPLYCQDAFLTQEIFGMLCQFFMHCTTSLAQAFVVDDSNFKTSIKYLKNAVGPHLNEVTPAQLKQVSTAALSYDIVLLYVATDNMELSTSLRKKIQALHFGTARPNRSKIMMVYCAGTSSLTLSEEQAFQNFRDGFTAQPPLSPFHGCDVRWEFPTLPKFVLIQKVIFDFRRQLTENGHPLDFLTSDLRLCLMHEPIHHLLDVMLRSNFLYQTSVILMENFPASLAPKFSARFDPKNPKTLAIFNDDASQPGKPFCHVSTPPVDLDAFPVEDLSSNQVQNLQTVYTLSNPQEAKMALHRFTQDTVRLCTTEHDPRQFADAFLDDHKRQVQEYGMQLVLPNQGDLKLVYDDALMFVQNRRTRFADYPVAVYARVVAELCRRQAVLKQEIEEIKADNAVIKADQEEIKQELREIKQEPREAKEETKVVEHIVPKRKFTADNDTPSKKRRAGYVTFVLNQRENKIRSVVIHYRVRNEDGSSKSLSVSFAVRDIISMDNPRQIIKDKAMSLGLDENSFMAKFEPIMARIERERT